MSEHGTSEAPERMKERLDELKAEYRKGHEQLRELMAQETATREALLRVSGAIQVLEEMVPQDGHGPDRRQDGAGGSPSPAAAPVVNVP